MHPELIRLASELYDLKIEGRSELSREEIEVLERWVEGDRAAVDAAIRETLARFTKPRTHETSILAAILGRHIERQRKLEKLHQAICRTRDQGVHRTLPGA